MTTRTPNERIAINALISARILAAQADGLELPAAIDRVLGEGSYAEIVSDLYDALCVKAKARARAGD